MTADAVGGVWTYAVELTRALASHGVEVAIATMGVPPSAAQRAEVAALPNATLHESAFRLEWMADPWDDVARAGDWLLSLERRQRPDVVHLNGYAHAALPWRAPALVVAHSCVCSWWRAVHGAPAPAEWDRYRATVRRGLRAARLLVAPTRAMLHALAEHHGPLPAARVVPNARDSRRFVPDVEEPFVFAAGRLWDEAKNVGALARVAPRLPWPVYVAGDAAAPDGSAPTLAGVRVLGRLDERAMASWLGRAAVFALPARYEPFGLSALEAALAGCALVLGDIPSLREVWGDAAAYVPPDDADALGATITTLATSAPRRERLAARARARAATYAPARQAAAYLHCYHQLLRTPVSTCA
ncbi:MAG TPA: glycosyltransferase family 4 protein [Gemmatimonadaceae bacterium]|nr:glycosyltransferase family 4 protein [Gemmatimonadaceae bacterium]